MILKAERDMQAELEKQKLRDDDIKISKPPGPRPNQKNRKRFIFRLRSQKNCECS
jgi:hypothetical protein